MRRQKKMMMRRGKSHWRRRKRKGGGHACIDFMKLHAVDTADIMSVVSSQNQLKDQELRNERLSVKLQQRYKYTTTCHYIYLEAHHNR